MNLIGAIDPARSEPLIRKDDTKLDDPLSSLSLSPTDSPAFIAVDAEILRTLLLEVRSLDERVSSLEEDNRKLREELKAAQIWTTPLRVDDLFEALDNLEQRLGPKEPGPCKKDRGDILRALLASEGPMLASTARKKMHLSSSQFSQLLSSLREYIELKPYGGDHRQNVLRLKNKNR